MDVLLQDKYIDRLICSWTLIVYAHGCTILLVSFTTVDNTKTKDLDIQRQIELIYLYLFIIVNIQLLLIELVVL